MQFKKQNWLKLGLELFVVFLGITAGFLLNNWEISNQEVKIEQKYLQGFSQDVKNNISELDSAIIRDSIWIVQANEFITIINDGGLPIDSTHAAIAFISHLNTLEINVSTYDDIINSGNLNLIRSFHLKAQIIKYHNVIATSKFMDDYLKEFFNDFLLPFLVAETNIMTIEFNNPEMIKSVRYTNLLGIYYSFINQRITVYKEFLEESQSLNKELDISRDF